MYTNLTFRSILVAAVLGSGGAASALSLGPVTGTTVVGRPLELSAPIQFDELVQGSSGGCVSADVVYGDRVIDTSRVQLTLAQDGPRQGSLARITSAVLVDEPVVTVILRAGCARQSVRRYVLLADAPRNEPAASGSSLALLSAPALLLPVAMGTPVQAEAPLRGTKSSSRRDAPRRPATAVASYKSGSVVPDGARLQLAVWDPGSEQLPWLRTSGELRSLPSADAAQRAAATALWRALNARPEDLLRSADRLRSLEGEVSSLRGLAARHRTEISSARESLHETHRRSYTSLALAVLLSLLAGSAAAFFLHRSRHASSLVPYTSWYPAVDAPGEAVVNEPVEPATPVAAVHRQASPAVLPARARPPVAAPESAPDLADGVIEFTLPDVTEADPAPAAVEMRPGLKVDALHGAQQQAEFFASLGQFDEAISVLTDYIEESSEKPVLAFLELFRLYHALGMQTEYGELQALFKQTFRVDVAPFAEFKEEHRDLEMYPVAVARIAASWATLDGLDIIEGLLFHAPSARRDLLSMDAYRELLWLYSLGQEITHSTSEPAGLQLLDDGGLPNSHFIMPWDAGHQDGQTELSLELLNTIDVASGSNAFAVDIDLTSMPGTAMQQSWHEGRSEPAGSEAKEEPASAPESFDSVMESQTRKLFR